MDTMLEEKTLEVGNARISFWGNHEGTPALLFLAGGLCDHRSWMPQLLTLQANYQVLAFDPRGCGASEEVGPYDISQQANDAAQLIQTVIKKPVVVVSHSLGGYAALLLNHTHSPLVLANVFMDVPLSEAGTNTAHLVHALAEAKSLVPLHRMVESMSTLAPPEVRTLLQEMMLTRLVEVAIGMLSGLEPVTEHMAELLEEAITKPSLAIWPGPNPMGGDPTWLRHTYPSLQQEFLGQVGHFVQLEAPQATNSLLTHFVENLSLKS